MTKGRQTSIDHVGAIAPEIEIGLDAAINLNYFAYVEACVEANILLFSSLNQAPVSLTMSLEIGGFKAWITVGGKKLPCYDVVQNEGGKEVTGWIASKENKVGD